MHGGCVGPLPLEKSQRETDLKDLRKTGTLGRS